MVVEFHKMTMRRLVTTLEVTTPSRQIKRIRVTREADIPPTSDYIPSGESEGSSGYERGAVSGEAVSDAASSDA